MRSLFMASAAIILTAGIAGAQSASPAPTGAPNAATTTSPGMSPGNTAPAPGSTSGNPPAYNSTRTTSPLTNSGSSGSMTPPAPDMSPSAAGTSTMGMAPPEKMKPMMSMSHSMGMGHMAMPADAPTATYLKMAKGAIKHHNKMMADDALSHAETRLLDRSVTAGSIMPDSSPAVASIDTARKALAAGDMKAATSATDMAMQQSMMPAQ